MRLIAMDFARVHAEMGVLVGKGGFYGNVFRITPPLCFTKEDADFFVAVMDSALSKL
jgi:alanine-glyoxylate transaminase/(R)-3-amino-2-methylpropionate-pyruvate transaminase